MERYSERSQILRKTYSLASEKLHFLDGRCVGDINLNGESGDTLRKIRRILEKRVSQSLKKKDVTITGNLNRYKERHWLTNYMKNIYGFIPA